MLLLGDHLAQPQISRRGASIKFLARDMALFDTQHSQSLRTVGDHLEFLARFHQGFPNGETVIRGCVHLVSHFT